MFQPRSFGRAVQALLWLVLMAWPSRAQTASASSDLSDLPRLKNFSAHRVSSNNRYVTSNDDSKRIMPGETFVMADLTGPGVVNHIWVTIADNEFAWPRLARLRVYYDGKKTPSVDVPLGDFFGIGHGYERDLTSLLIRDSSFGRARNSYWPMPFLKTCKITVTDEGSRPLAMFYYHVDWQKHESLPKDVAYFHGYYRQERPARSGANYAFLDVKGSGHYVGTVLNVIQSGVGWFGEGDDLFYVDGEKRPSITGTGSEDYFNDAWGLRPSSGPWTGTPVAEGERVGARLTGYRWHVPDPIPFTKSLWAGIEHAGWTYEENGKLRSGFEQRPDFFSSAAFWYQEGVNEGLPEPPFGEARLPLGNAEQIAPEEYVSQITTEGGTASVQREVDWGRDLLAFHARGPGSRVNVPLEVKEAGKYEIVARLARGPIYGDYYVLLDGKVTNVDNREAATSEVPSAGAEIFRNYAPEIYIAMEHPLGWITLTRGRHILTFVCAGHDGQSQGYDLGLNDLVLEKVPPLSDREDASDGDRGPETAATGVVYRGRSLAAYQESFRQARATDRAAVLRSMGSFGEDAASAVVEISEGLRDQAIDVRRAAAWAASQLGSSGSQIVPALAKTLTDSDDRVRSMSAIALRSIGPGAVRALPALTTALDDPRAFVRALSADAIGNLGPNGRSGVSALSQHLLGKGEEVMVMRSIAAALGNIGPDAASALPALEQAAKSTRVSYVAEAAIAKINGRPLPTY
jgi:Protein of unknown function (DUF2961)/HEAT repeats